MFKRILVAYDDSPEASKALQTGINLAKICSMSLTTVTVEEGLPVYVTAVTPYGTLVTPEVIDDIRQQRDAFYNQLRKDAVDKAAEQGVSLHTEVISGSEVESIVDYAKSIDADLLVVGYHKHSVIRDRILGSTAHGITLSAPCSVLAVK